MAVTGTTSRDIRLDLSTMICLSAAPTARRSPELPHQHWEEREVSSREVVVEELSTQEQIFPQKNVYSKQITWRPLWCRSQDLEFKCSGSRVFPLTNSTEKGIEEKYSLWLEERLNVIGTCWCNRVFEIYKTFTSTTETRTQQRRGRILVVSSLYFSRLPIRDKVVSNEFLNWFLSFEFFTNILLKLQTL